eukprot:TRINITY_DN80114_c0_g1_i1.p1 TRINITY_DN80114_c0_g1~~TRINITY_DN80114_c0_g1_i1.p1  ORF type:complete len:156 (-),score=6.41 TRINITY_DN80114_c0_g1_i1:92-559(-)
MVQLPPISSPKQPCNSSLATFHKNGQVFAVAHPTPKTGYKAHQLSGTKFEATTTYKAVFSGGNNDPHAKLLQPYSPTAARNRLPVEFSGENKRKQRYGNVKRTVNPITDNTTDSATRFVTTNQRAYGQHTASPVGYTNQGIVSEHTKWAHKRLHD